MWTLLSIFAIDLLCLAAANGFGDWSSLPVVDLGYAMHQAASFNRNSSYYNFTNIRFGAPPTGEHRFRAPLPPATNRTLTAGSPLDIRCPQAAPDWLTGQHLATTPTYLTGAVGPQVALLNKALLSGNDRRYHDVLQGIITSDSTSSNSSNGANEAPGMTEDCLFLDVIVPQSTWDKRTQKSAPKAPVLVWMSGGGYVESWKRNTEGDGVAIGDFPRGLVTRSINSANASNEMEPTIVVSLNYRLGMFGFLGGSSVADDGTLNAGLLDQRLGLEWVQKYIHLFGGDTERVIVAGESAGGGSIIFQLTAYGGLGGALPFTGAIPQSMTFYPQSANDPRPEHATLAILKAAHVTTLKQLRQVPSETLMRINAVFVSSIPYGFWGFAPLVDGSFVPDLPGRLIQQGRFHKTARLLMGHNAHEGFIFTPPKIPNTTIAFDTVVQQQYPAANDATLHEIEQSLYPPDFSDRSLYKTAFARQQLLYQESQFTCNNLAFAQALPNQSFWYTFEGPPGYHSQDLAYTWADYPPIQSTAVNATVATTLQEWILSFTASGLPKASSGAINFPTYGEGRRIMRLGSNGIETATDKTNLTRCQFWNDAPYAI